MEAALRISGKDKWLSMDEVHERVKLSPANIYKLIGEGQFPPPIKANQRSFWLESEVEAWKQAKIDESRKDADGWKRNWVDVRRRTKKNDGTGKK